MENNEEQNDNPLQYELDAMQEERDSLISKVDQLQEDLSYERGEILRLEDEVSHLKDLIKDAIKQFDEINTLASDMSNSLKREIK